MLRTSYLLFPLIFTAFPWDRSYPQSNLTYDQSLNWIDDVKQLKCSELKTGLLILEFGFYHYSCILQIAFTLTKQNDSFVRWRKILTFFLPVHVKWLRKMKKNKINPWSSAVAELLQVFQAVCKCSWAVTLKMLLWAKGIVWISPPIILACT